MRWCAQKLICRLSRKGEHFAQARWLAIRSWLQVKSALLRACGATEGILRVTSVCLACHPKLTEGERRMAERVGFEPTCPFGQDAFEAPPLRPLRYLSAEACACPPVCDAANTLF